MDIRTIVSNPNGQAFQSKYLHLGRYEGKKQLHADCRQIGIRATVKALQVIENGYSHKCKITYANDITRCDYDFGRLGDPSQKGTAKRCNKGKKDGELDIHGRIITKNNTETKPVETEEEKKEEKKVILLKEKAARIEKKKQKIWEKQKIKMAELDSWEDF
jgi:hypothetical protein